MDVPGRSLKVARFVKILRLGSADPQGARAGTGGGWDRDVASYSEASPIGLGHGMTRLAEIFVTTPGPRGKLERHPEPLVRGRRRPFSSKLWLRRPR
jgi:hypothetical protein